MRALIKTYNPDEILVTMTLTGTLKEFKDLQERINSKWPGWQFGSFINQAVNKFNRSVSTEDAAI